MSSWSLWLPVPSNLWWPRGHDPGICQQCQEESLTYGGQMLWKMKSLQWTRLSSLTLSLTGQDESYDIDPDFFSSKQFSRIPPWGLFGLKQPQNGLSVKPFFFNAFVVYLFVVSVELVFDFSQNRFISTSWKLFFHKSHIPLNWYAENSIHDSIIFLIIRLVCSIEKWQLVDAILLELALFIAHLNLFS